MPGEVRLEPIVALTDAPTADENHASLGVLFIDLFFLPDHLRGHGLGSRLLQLAQDEARPRGCISAVLDTINFQAPDFYERHGYQVLGIVPCLPPGTRRIFMMKPLA